MKFLLTVAVTLVMFILLGEENPWHSSFQKSSRFSNIEESAEHITLKTHDARSFVAIHKQLPFNTGDNIEIAITLQKNDGVAFLVISENAPWGKQKAEDKVTKVKIRVPSNSESTYKYTYTIGDKPTFIGVGYYKNSNGEMTIKSIVFNKKEKKISQNYEIQMDSSIPLTKWEQITENLSPTAVKCDKDIVQLHNSSAEEWNALRMKLGKVAAGEMVKFSAQVDSLHENAIIIVTSGFVWGEAVNGKPYHKVQHSGTGKKELMTATILSTGEDICIGLGLERGVPNCKASFSNIKLSRERDFLPAIAKEKIETLKYHKFNANCPKFVQKKLAQQIETLEKYSQELLVLEDEKNIAQTLNLLRNAIKDSEKLVIVKNSNIIDKKISSTSSEVVVQLYSFGSKHSVWYKFNSNNIKIYKFVNNQKFPLNQANAIRVGGEPVTVCFELKKSGELDILSLDHSYSEIDNISIN